MISNLLLLIGVSALTPAPTTPPIISVVLLYTERLAERLCGGSVYTTSKNLHTFSSVCNKNILNTGGVGGAWEDPQT